jgi:hypothetical protein
MTRDAIVEEVRAFRDEIAREYDYDIDAIFAALRQMEATSGGRHVSFAPRKISDREPGNSPEVADRLDVAGDAALRRR